MALYQKSVLKKYLQALDADAVENAYEKYKENPQPSDMKAAIEMYNQSLKLNPNNTKTLRNLGILYYEREEFETALKCYEKVLEIDPKNTMAKIYKSKCLKSMNQ